MTLPIIEYIEKEQERARARAGDPETSHEAAASVRNLSEVQEKVLHVLKFYGPLPDHMIYKKVIWLLGKKPVTKSNIRSRRAELVKKGLVAHKGLFDLNENNNRCRVWEIA